MDKFSPSTTNADDMKPSCSRAVARANSPKEHGASVLDEQIDIDAGGDKPDTKQKEQCNGVGSVPKPILEFSLKILIGRLPPDIEEPAIFSAFSRFGSVEIHWPQENKANLRSPPKAFAFLIYKTECSVKELIRHCDIIEGKFYYYVSSEKVKNKRVEVRPWRLTDAKYTPNPELSYDPRLTVYVSGVPCPIKAFELTGAIESKYGGVYSTSIDIDCDNKYPKGSARVCFANKLSYMSAISARFIHLGLGEFDKVIEVKPFELDHQLCEVCKKRDGPLFCGNITCLQYLCHKCWPSVHSLPGRTNHKVIVKGGTKSHFVDLFR